jgi:hypothetical protein
MINLKNAFADKNKFGSDASQTISKFGLIALKSLTVYRRPLMDATMNLMNAVTIGTVQKKLKNSPYDTLFHLGCYIVLENGSLVEVDKQHS